MSEQIASRTVLVYSDDPKVREHTRLVIGQRPAAAVQVSFVEAATAREVVTRTGQGGIDLVVLDGEAAPAGGLGLARQLKDEVPGCPPTLVAIARSADRWLAAYAGADATLTRPLDPVRTARTVVELLRQSQERPAS
ncbi:MAG: hypothetical protein HKP61_13165 [Dactylosporangium sp.]|nr:hypothetical protein [Dactylosporangium sp.]NNJ61866.1 hypothetical protein [Dactylosporangium sp.]